MGYILMGVADRSFPQYYYITGMYDIYVSTITTRDQNKK